MEIILLERVENLGGIGDVVTVKDGYARNFLLPNHKALRANAANRKRFEENRARIEEENAAKRTDAEKAGEKVDGTQIVLIRAASNSGQLYGSVSVRDIVQGVNEQDGPDIEKSMVVLDKPIKELGLHDVRIRLHPEVNVTVKVNVARSPEEADKQEAGIDVIAEMFEKEQAEIATEYNPDAEPGEVAVTREPGEEEAEASTEAETGEEAVAADADHDAAEAAEAAEAATGEDGADEAKEG